VGEGAQVMSDQRSLTEQLHDLHRLAVERGMYDAADWLEWAMTPPSRRSYAVEHEHGDEARTLIEQGKTDLPVWQDANNPPPDTC